MSQIENEVFYRRIRKRDETAFEELMDQYSKLLWAVGSRLNVGSDGMDLEELVSDVFLRLWQHPEKFQADRGSLKSYLCIMMDSLTKNKLKQNARYRHDDLSELMEVGKESDQVARLDEEAAWQEIYDLIMEIDEPTRRLLLWRIFYDLKPEEITKKSGLSAKEVDNRLYRGKLKLRKLLERNLFYREVDGYE